MASPLCLDEISRRLSRTLDSLGYSPQLVQLRKSFYKIKSDLIDPEGKESLEFMIAGSRGEGVVKLYESDFDILCTTKAVIVVEDGINTKCISELVSVFRMVPCLSHPGHYKLSLVRQGFLDQVTGECLNPFENDLFLSRKEFLRVDNDDNGSVTGPAESLTIIYDNVPFQCDFVTTFPCVCPSILNQWIRRPRRHDWPPGELRRRISSMQANIVPTGQKGCPNEEIEWRLCFNEIELLLVGSWNETQVKLYRLLKMIKKDVFVKAEFDITTFIMKNIVMWLSETYPQSSFRPEKLLLWVFKSLRLLRKAVIVYSLPYYMVPGRNLIAERIPRHQRKGLIKEISDLLHCGPKLLWECEKLEFAMSMSHHQLLYYGDRCHRLEVLLIAWFIRKEISNIVNNPVNVLVQNEIVKEEKAIVLYSQWPHVVAEMLKDKTDWFDKCMLLMC